MRSTWKTITLNATLCFALAVGGLAACDDDVPGTVPDVSSDAGIDSGSDAGSDAAADTGNPDVGTDQGPDPDTSGDTNVNPALAAYQACFPYLVEVLDIDVIPETVVAEHCAGTNHQTIDDVDKIVVLGDSISVGVGANNDASAYFSILRENLEAYYGHSIAFENCAVGGSVNANLQGQINTCFPGVESARTLVVFTSGGNDVANMAFNDVNLATGVNSVDAMIGYLDSALAVFDDTTKFPAGVFVVLADVYEYTDATAVLQSCPLATFAGFPGVWADALGIFRYLTAEYVRTTTKYGRDMIFMQETFCGHGHNKDSPDGPCHEVAGELWFGRDCLHPNDMGHKAIADLFYRVVVGLAPPQ
ncbi:MAG: lysophospholipase L1-like esterase [Myxococcota bacterium]|jgi:lysophospholipase L1-like esterase